MNEILLISLAAIAVMAIGAQWLASRLQLPSILMLLVFGFLAGPVTGLIDPDLTFGPLLFPLVSLSVAIILFEGGLSLNLAEIPRLGGVVLRLISLGALVTWAVATLSARFFLGLDWSLSLLLGAILIVTGPTVVGPLLRQIRPLGKSGKVLKWEGILIDPVGAVLAVLIFEAILEGELGQAPELILLGVLQTLIIGLLLGALAAAVIVLLMRRYWVPDYLHGGVTLLVVTAAFAVSNLLHPEAGLLTVTVMGVALANQKQVSVKHIAEFKENLQVLLIGTLFILLGSRLRLGDLEAIRWQALLFVAVLIFVARPLAVLVSTWGSDLSKKERLFLSWMAPRGIVAASVASIFAFELAEAGYARAEELVPLTFLVIVATVLIYGLTAGPLARRLGLADRDPQGFIIIGANRLSRAIAVNLSEQGIRVALVDSDLARVVKSQQLGLTAYHDDALSEALLEDLDLAGIGRMMALTRNDDVNSLAVIRFVEIVGRVGAFQLTASSIMHGPDSAAAHLRGRFLFSNEATYEVLDDLMRQGASIQAIPLTEEFDFPAFQSLHDNQALPLFLLRNGGKVSVFTTDSQPAPRPGQTLITLLPPGAVSQGAG